MVMEKLRNVHGIVMKNYFVKSVGTLVISRVLTKVLNVLKCLKSIFGAVFPYNDLTT